MRKITSKQAIAVSTSAGAADAAKFVITTGTGKIDSSLLPSGGTGWTDDTYDSGWVSLPSNPLVYTSPKTFTHNKNGLPSNLRFYLKCISNEGTSWLTTDPIVESPIGILPTHWTSIEYTANAINWIFFAGNGIAVRIRNSNSYFFIDPSKWQMRCLASLFKTL